MLRNRLRQNLKGTRLSGSKNNKSTKTKLITSKNWPTLSISSIWSKNCKNKPKKFSSSKYPRDP